MKKFSDESFDQERALYGLSGAEVTNCRFEGPADGESALKECSDITVRECTFDLRYPLWHVIHADISDVNMTTDCRAALWYDRDVHISSSTMNGIKAVRECENIIIENSVIDSPEFGWKCTGLTVRHSELTSEYPFLDSSDVNLDHVRMNGKYSFQYVDGSVIRDSELHTKDAFWHSHDITVYDSVVDGEYLGWYSENLHLVRCVVIGTQPLCYCRGLVLEDCVMKGCSLSFERSEVNATIRGDILSVKNPLKGSIEADSIGDIVLDIPEAKKGVCRISTRK